MEQFVTAKCNFTFIMTMCLLSYKRYEHIYYTVSVLVGTKDVHQAVQKELLQSFWLQQKYIQNFNTNYKPTSFLIKRSFSFLCFSF